MLSRFLMVETMKTDYLFIRVEPEVRKKFDQVHLELKSKNRSIRQGDVLNFLLQLYEDYKRRNLIELIKEKIKV